MAKHPAEVFGYPIKLNGMAYHDEHATVFTIYDMKKESGKYKLFDTRIESSTIDDLFKAFRNNPNIPSIKTIMLPKN